MGRAREKKELSAHKFGHTIRRFGEVTARRQMSSKIKVDVISDTV